MKPLPEGGTIGVAAAIARDGDVAAFSRIMEAEQARLMAQALAFCGNAHLAQDLVQETMIAAWKSLHRFDGSCRLFTWLYVILLRQHRRSLGWFSRRLPLATLEQQAMAARHEPVTPDEGGGADDGPRRAARAQVLLCVMLGAKQLHRAVGRRADD